MGQLRRQNVIEQTMMPEVEQLKKTVEEWVKTTDKVLKLGLMHNAMQDKEVMPLNEGLLNRDDEHVRDTMIKQDFKGSSAKNLQIYADFTDNYLPMNIVEQGSSGSMLPREYNILNNKVNDKYKANETIVCNENINYKYNKFEASNFKKLNENEKETYL